MPRTLRRGFLSAIAALMCLSAGVGPTLAKWTIVVEFEPTTATAGDPTRLAALVSIPSHDVPGMEVPSLSDIEPVTFRLTSVESREVIEVPGVRQGRAGRYIAEMTLPEPGDWQMQLYVTLGDRKVSHLDFPDQVAGTVTVASQSIGGMGVVGAALGAVAVVVLLASHRWLSRRGPRRIGWVPS